MKTVKVMLEGKNGKEFEALVPIEVACMAMYCGAYYKDSRISRIGYSVVRKIHEFCIHEMTEEEEINQANYFIGLMEREERMICLSGVELYRD